MDPERKARSFLSLRGRIGAAVLHSQRDSRELTANARAAFDKTFLDAVDPERALPEEERNRRAAHARTAYYSRLALASAKARRSKSQPHDRATGENRDGYRPGATKESRAAE